MRIPNSVEKVVRDNLPEDVIMQKIGKVNGTKRSKNPRDLPSL